MRWIEKDMRKAGIALAGILLLLVLMVWVPVSAVGAYEGASGLATPGTGTVQATPTEDATVTALNKEKLQGEVDQQQRTFGNWLWSNAAAILSSFLSTLVVVIGALIGYRQWRVGRKDAQAKELEDRRAERERQAEEQKRSLEDRAEERFQAAVVGLGDDKGGARIGAAILLRTFLHEGQGYEQFYVQTFDLAVANLRLASSLPSPESPDGLSHLPEHSNDTFVLLPTLSQALIVAFKEAFPLAREWLTKQHPAFFHQMLDAAGVQLDNAYLSGADLKLAWMLGASMRAAQLYSTDLSGANLNWTNLSGANLSRADLSGIHLYRADLSGAHLSWADLSQAYLYRANLRGADLRRANLHDAKLWEANLSGANLRGADLSGAELRGADLSGANLYEVKGLTEGQLEACKAQGAIFEEASTASSSQPPVLPSPSSESLDAKAPSAPPAQVNTLAPDAGGSSGTSSQPTPEA